MVDNLQLIMNITISEDFAKKFANHWIESWNSHNLSAILSHYTDDFEMYSPLISERMGIVEGRLKGKMAVAEYWEIGLSTLPKLHFELVGVLTGVDSVIIQYKGRRGLACEAFFFNAQGKVSKAVAHYE